MASSSSYDHSGQSRRSSQSRSRRSGSQSSRSSRQSSRSSRQRSASQGRRRSSNDALRSNRNYRTLTGNDTGFTLRQRQINFTNPRSSRTTFIMLGIGAVIVVLLIFGISSCVRSCSAKRNAGSADTSVNTQDSRVASGATPEITSKLTPALDYAEALQRIANNASAYTDSRMIDLATTVTEAANYVANYPSADRTAVEFNDAIVAGVFPVLYDWDSRWGYTDYADGAFGVTGSGPTVLAMAYMGLTGENTQTPYSIGQIVTATNLATGEAGLDKSFFENTNLSKVGMSANSYSSTTDDLSVALSGGTPAAVLVRASTLTNYAHWILVTGYAEDGSLVVNDPTSTNVSTRTWAPGTIVSYAEAIYALSPAATTSTSDDDSQQASSQDGYDSESGYDSDSN